MSRLIIGLQRLGIAFFSFHVLAIPGRRSGTMRATVVSPFTASGHRYVLSIGDLAWVHNARAAGWGILGRGRRQTRVNLVEIKPPESASIVGEFPVQIPAGVQLFIQLGLSTRPADRTSSRPPPTDSCSFASTRPRRAAAAGRSPDLPTGER